MLIEETKIQITEIEEDLGRLRVKADKIKADNFTGARRRRILQLQNVLYGIIGYDLGELKLVFDMKP